MMYPERNYGQECDDLAIIELTCIGVLYYLGYSAYCGDHVVITVLSALLCSAFLLSFLRRIWRGRYLNMSMGKIDRLSGEAFEEYLYVQFKRLGYRVRFTEASHDYGADLILKKRGKRIVVQAKRYDRNIGIAAVQEAVASVAYYEADQAMVVTNQFFTKSAWNLARQNDVILWTREDMKKRFRIRGV